MCSKAVTAYAILTVRKLLTNLVEFSLQFCKNHENYPGIVNRQIKVVSQFEHIQKVCYYMR